MIFSEKLKYVLFLENDNYIMSFSGFLNRQKIFSDNPSMTKNIDGNLASTRYSNLD